MPEDDPTMNGVSPGVVFQLLIDRTVMKDAVQAESRMVVREAELLGQKLTYLHPESRLIKPRQDGKNWRQQAIDALPYVAAAIREGRLRAFTTFELEAELMRVAKYPTVRHEHSLLAGCTIETLPAPLDRSKWGLSPEEYLSKEHLIHFCRTFLISSSDKRVAELIRGMRVNPRYRLTEFEEEALRQLPVFRAICRHMDETHYPDALHLWTAELNGMDAFLSHDRKFRNVIDQQKVSLRCRILTARELADMLQEAAAREQ